MMTDREKKKWQILRNVMLEHAVTLNEIRSKSRLAHLVEARIDAAQQLSVAGFTPGRIGEILKRDRTVIACYLNGSVSTVRKLRNIPELIKALPTAARQAILEIAECQQTSPAVIAREWLTERAQYELEAKQKCVGSVGISLRSNEDAVCEAA